MIDKGGSKTSINDEEHSTMINGPVYRADDLDSCSKTGEGNNVD